MMIVSSRPAFHWSALVVLATLPSLNNAWAPLPRLTRSTWHISHREASRSSIHDENRASIRVVDTVPLGTLQIPTVGTGTISWSSDNRTYRATQQRELEHTLVCVFQCLTDDSSSCLETNNFAALKLTSPPSLQELVQTTLDSNAAFFDTAERYGSHLKTAIGLGWGETERLLGSMLPPHTRADGTTAIVSSASKTASPIVATKFTPTPWRTAVDSVVQACEQSRQRLGVDQIDLYQLHMPDIVQPFRFLGHDHPKDVTYWDGLIECYHRGLVKNVGVCNYGPTLLLQCQEHLSKRGVPLASNQIAYSLLGRHNGAQETLDVCHDVNVTLLAYYPFAMGLLTGKYHTDQIEWSSKALESLLTRSQKTRLEELDLRRYAEGDGATIPLGGIAPLLQVLQDIAQTRGATVSQVALNYIISKGAVPIPGARNAAQVADNLGAMGWRLSSDEVLRLEEASDALGFGFDGAGFKRTSEKFVGYGVEKWALT